MVNNDVLRSVRYMLNVDDAAIAAIIRLAGHPIDGTAVAALLKREDESGYRPCSDEVMAQFLNGLIIFKRGVKADAAPQPLQVPVTNNMVLKKLRVAFELQDSDMHAILTSVGFDLSKPELSALFRKADHKNFRPCGDQLLRNFLVGLTMRVRAS